MTWLRPVDRTSGTLTLSAGTLSCLAHHGTPLSERCPTTTALERTIVPMDDAERMPPLGAVKPRQKFFDVIHRAQCVAPVTGILSGRPNSEVPFWSALGACRSAGPLRRYLDVQTCHAGQVAAGPVKAGHKPKLNRVERYPEDDWNLAGRRLRRQCRGGAGGDNRGYLTANQLGRQCRQPVHLILGPAVFDRHVLAFDIAGLTDALAKSTQPGVVPVGRLDVQNADQRRCLLRACGTRHCRDGAAERRASDVRTSTELRFVRGGYGTIGRFRFCRSPALRRAKVRNASCHR